MPSLSLTVCRNFEGEARAVLEDLDARDVALTVFPARCGRPPLQVSEVRELLGSCGAGAELVGSVCCSALQRSSELPEGCRVHAFESCFELLAPRPMVEAQVREGAYVLTPGWLRRWRERLQDLGLDDAELARQLFGESTTKLLLLDSGIEPGARAHLEELSEHLAIPAGVMPVGVGLLRERVLRWRAEATLAAERKRHAAALSAAHRQSAEYAAAFDVVGCLADSVEEREVVERTLDVCATLFAPRRVAYLSVNGGGSQLDVSPPLDDSTERARIVDALSRRIDPPGGFAVAIEHGGELFGVLGVEEVAFPRYRDRYLDLATTVARVCGMAVANARAFQELKLAKDAAALERERLAVTLNSIGDGVIATDCDGNVLLVNQVCADLTGFAQHEAVGRPLGEVFRVLDERTRAPLVNPVEQVLRAGKAVELIDDALLVRRDGVEHHVADSASPIFDRDGRTLGVVLVFRDVTAHKRTRALHRVLDEATQLLASSLDMPRVLGEVCRLVSAQLGVRCDIDAGPASASAAAVGCAGSPELVVPMCSGGGQQRGRLALASGGALDAEQVAFARELARRVALTLENAVHLETARHAVLVRDRFLSVASHEMKTPLTALLLQGESMSKRIARGDAVSPEQVERLTSILLRQVRRVRRLVDDMLDVSRMNVGTLQLRPERVDLSHLVASELENRAEELRAAGYAVTARLEADVVGTCDPQRIEQVVANLLGNAIRYGRGKPIDVVLARDGATATLSVTDRGPGIDPSDHERIFSAFERAANGAEVPGGLGLGLYIVSHIVAAHGGSVRVESALGDGATFLVRLPLEPPG